MVVDGALDRHSEVSQGAGGQTGRRAGRARTEEPKRGGEESG